MIPLAEEVRGTNIFKFHCEYVFKAVYCLYWSFILFALNKHNFAFWCIGNHHVEAVMKYDIKFNSWLLKKLKSLSKFVFVAQNYYIFSWVRQHIKKFQNML